MSEHGASLQTYNQELVKCLEDLKGKRSDILTVIKGEESEKQILEKQISMLQEKLQSVNHALDEHKNLYDNYSKTISDTENGFKKILESSQTLLNLMQHQATKLDDYTNKNVGNKAPPL